MYRRQSKKISVRIMGEKRSETILVFIPTLSTILRGSKGKVIPIFSVKKLRSS